MISNRANTPEEKSNVLQLIEEHWKLHPQLRLMQLLLCAIKPQTLSEVFVKEDYDLLADLDQFERSINQIDVTNNFTPDS